MDLLANHCSKEKTNTNKDGRRRCGAKEGKQKRRPCDHRVLQRQKPGWGIAVPPSPTHRPENKQNKTNVRREKPDPRPGEAGSFLRRAGHRGLLPWLGLRLTGLPCD